MNRMLTQPLPDAPSSLSRSCPPPVTARFLHWTRHTPQAPAIREAGRIWCYDELARMAIGIAGQIQDAGCMPGDIVAISGQRGVDFIASLLGVLLARCVALPLDPGQPSGWRREVLDAANPELVLVCGESPLPAEQLRCLSIASHSLRAPLKIQISSFRQRPESSIFNRLDTGLRRCDEFLEVPLNQVSAGYDHGFDHAFETAALDDPAYLFFTSGTTGRPKGVLGTHGGLGHFLAWQGECFAVKPEDRVAHVTGLSFDVVLREIFVALTNGASLCIPSRESLEDPRQLTSWLVEEEITLLHAVPTVAAAWLNEADPATRFPRMRVTFFAGEPLLRQLVLRWRERTGSAAEIINLYGPTETTLAKCWYRVPQFPASEQIPVGMPLPECEVYVLDENDLPVAHGETGEVVIRTPWRSLGYLHGATPFRRNPLGSDAQDRVYPTGDRGRWLADGSLELLGRIDDQVKIRGVRIEPAGVAAVLAGHPAVSACAVLALTVNSQPGLTAFVAGAAGRVELRRYLAERLADAMIPTEFVFLDALPCNANGKLDRARLLTLAAESAATAEQAVHPASPPRTASELGLAGIYRELLDLAVERPLSVSDDFFDLGGDSLLAMAVISRVNQILGVQLDVGDLFESPDIQGLARRIDALQGRVAQPASAPLLAVPRNQKLPLAPAQERIWFQCLLEGEQATAYNVAVAIEISGRLDESVLQRAWQALCRRHEVLRSTFPVHDGTAWQEIGPEMLFSLPLMDLGHLQADAQADRVRQLAQQQADQPFRLDKDCMLRALLLRRNDHQHLLLLTVHHLVFDGWSRWLLMRELGEHYAAALCAEDAALPALAVQYADYAVWRRQQRPRPESLAYWRQQLQDAPRTDFPGDFQRPALPSFHGAQVTRYLSPELVESLEALGVQERATLYMLLLTGFKIVLSRWSGSLDLTIGSPVANRPHPDLEPLLGCFIETLPIRTDLSGKPSCLEVLRRIRGGVIDAFVHADVPFEKIVEQVGPPRLPNRHPLFDIMFNLVSVPQHRADLEGLTLNFAEWAVPESRFDFSLYARKKNGGVELNLVYQKALFKAERMECLLAAFETVLRQIANDPKRSVAKLQIDLDQLPPPVAQAVIPAQAMPGDAPPLHVAPRTADEEMVAAVYRELLGRDAISVHDNFFALGGHSLLAAQALSRLRRQFRSKLPLRLLFTCQTVADLAAAVRLTLSETNAKADGGAPITLSQLRLLNFMADHPCSDHYNVSRKMLLRGRVDPDSLEQAIRQVAARHKVLSTGYRMAAGKYSPISLAEELIPLQRFDVRTVPDPEAAAEKLISAEIARPFVLDSGPMLRAVLIRNAELEHTLLISVHHVSADCWSMGMPFGPFDQSARAWMAGVFFRQLWHCYRALLAGREIALPQPPYQFDEVARQQNAWLAGAEAARQLAYWKELLADRPQALEIPPDFARPPVWDFRGERLRLCIDPTVTAALRVLSQERDTTLFVVLQSAFSALLHCLTGAEELVTGTTTSNRALWDADDLVGFFSNDLLLRTQLAGDPSFHDIIQSSHAAAFAALACQEVPFERILEELRTPPAADRHALFQIRFLLHLPTDRPFVEDDLCMVPVAIGREVAKYDLTLLLADDGTALEGWLEYATSLYRRATAEKILDQYRLLLAAMVARPDLPVSSVWSGLQ